MVTVRQRGGRDSDRQRDFLTPVCRRVVGEPLLYMRLFFPNRDTFLYFTEL